MKQKNKDDRKKNTFSKLLENNRFVFIFSLLISIIIWAGVSMYETPQIERVINDVKVQINYEGSLPANKGLQIFGENEYYVDVTVRGKSYIVNETDFASKYLSVTANLDGVYSAGDASIPVAVTITGGMGDNIEIVNVSTSNIDVYFDTYEERPFELAFELNKLEGYTDNDDYVIGNEVPVNGNTVTLAGPSLEMNRITAVKAQVTLKKAPITTESYNAELIPVTSDGKDIKYTAVKDETVVSYKIPVYKYCIMKPTVTFTNIPKAFTTVDYTISPAEVTMLVDTAMLDTAEISPEINVRTVDFSELLNKVNKIVIEDYTNDKYDLCDENREVCSSVDFTVTIDLSDRSSLDNLTLPVDKDSLGLPANVTASNVVNGVKIIGPESETTAIKRTINENYSEWVENYTSSASVVFASEIDFSTYAPGNYKIPAKVYFKTATGCWAYGNYNINVSVS